MREQVYYQYSIISWMLLSFYIASVFFQIPFCKVGENYQDRNKREFVYQIQEFWESHTTNMASINNIWRLTNIFFFLGVFQEITKMILINFGIMNRSKDPYILIWNLNFASRQIYVDEAIQWFLEFILSDVSDDTVNL